MTPQQDLICSNVRQYVGCSLHSERERLGQLIARGVDDPEKVVTVATNCAMFALGVMWLSGVDHELLTRPYRIGMAVSWVDQIGRDLGIRAAFAGQPLRAGMLLHYSTPGKSNDHVEWLLEDPVDGEAIHAGGGRPDNAITSAHGVILCSSGRPLRWVYDVPSALERVTPAEAGGP